MSSSSYKKILDALVPNIDDVVRDVGSKTLFGTVVNVAPLEIAVEGRSVYTEELLVVSAMCKKFVMFSTTTDTEDEPHSHYIPSFQTQSANGHTHSIGRVNLETASNVNAGHYHSVGNFYTEITNRHAHLFSMNVNIKPLSNTIKDYEPPNQNHFHEISNSQVYMTESAGEQPHQHEVAFPSFTKFLLVEIELWRELQVGDTVNMIMSSDKQKFYVIERQSGSWGRNVINNVATDISD